jgi:large subunit ribosomal protein L21
VIIFKKVRRSQYKRRNGHRQNYTAVRFEEISFGGHSVKAEPMKEKAAPAEAKAEPRAKKAAAAPKAKAAAAKPAAKKTATKKAK